MNVVMAIKTDEWNKKWCVYQLRDKNMKLHFIGISKLDKVFSFKEARSVPAFNTIFPDDDFCILEIMDMAENITEAMNKRYNRIQFNNGLPDMMKEMYIPGLTMIRCNETGELFRTIDEVANAHDINRGSLSQHLRKVGYYKKIKNRTYERILKY